MGKLVKVDFAKKVKKVCPWSKILHEHWPEEFDAEGNCTSPQIREKADE